VPGRLTGPDPATCEAGPRVGRRAVRGGRFARSIQYDTVFGKALEYLWTPLARSGSNCGCAWPSG